MILLKARGGDKLHQEILAMEDAGRILSGRRARSLGPGPGSPWGEEEDETLSPA